ncbi:4-amino-4-deoxy-L-arabinose transferase [Bradyrhizobium sp. HKCCYLS1011]|uniref:4-amino-4-deoxy-L-arabinose transferase n=1 Tax=Bradyrhizobium sp. HKCCYLS1011 TaxID=3420733 RepID=UPI003EB9BC8F
MTLPAAAAEPSDADCLAATATRPHPLLLILLLATACRLPLAFWPNFHHPDEIFQYLEPASRIWGDDSIVSWEWRHGIRSWLLPTIMAGPVAIGDWLVPGGSGAFILSRLLAAIASLSIVASAWAFGARLSRTHAILAGFVAAIWFEFVYFAPHTLSEPLATALILPAAVLLTRDPPTRRHLIQAGALLAFAVLIRFQYAPAIAVLVLQTCWRDWSRMMPLALGGGIVLAVGAMVDAAHGAVPFAWMVANIHQNLFLGRSAEFGTAPASVYGIWILGAWSLAVVPLALAVWQGSRRTPVLFWIALTNLVTHSLIAHKEYRFIFLSVTLFILLAALGSADWIATPRSPARRRWAGLLIAGGWMSASAVLAATGAMPDQWMKGIGAARLAAELKADPQMCGLALYDAPFYLLPGRSRLVGDKPLFALYSTDPLVRGRLAGTAGAVSSEFNRMLAYQRAAPELPANFTARDCDMVGGATLCIFARDGACEPTEGPDLTLNDVLERIDR